MENQPFAVRRQGFFCDDESIRYPFKESTVSYKLVLSVGFLINLLVVSVTDDITGSLLPAMVITVCSYKQMAACEAVHFVRESRMMQVDTIVVFNQEVKKWFYNTCCHIGVILFGIGVTLGIKLVVNSL